MKATVIAVFAVFAVAAAREVPVMPREEPFGECPPVDGPRPVYLMDITYRDLFYECESGTPIRHSCPKGLVFDPRVNVCNYPSIDCPRYGQVGTCPDDHCDPPVIRRDGTNMAVYYTCLEEGAVMSKCSDERYFDMVEKKCKYFA